MLATLEEQETFVHLTHWINNGRLKQLFTHSKSAKTQTSLAYGVLNTEEEEM